MENKVRAIKRPVYFTISLIAFPFCLPCLPPDGTVQNTVYIHTYRHTYVSACFWCTPIYVSIAFDPCTLYTHTHTRAQHFHITGEMYIVERSLVELYRLKPLQTVASFGCLSSYRKFRNAVSGYRSPDTASTSSLMDRINHGDIQASRRGNGEDFAINAKSLFSFPRFAFSRLLTRYIREQILFSFVNNIWRVWLNVKILYV